MFSVKNMCMTIREKSQENSWQAIKLNTETVSLVLFSRAFIGLHAVIQRLCRFHSVCPCGSAFDRMF